jgi:hypothetical protein
VLKAQVFFDVVRTVMQGGMSGVSGVTMPEISLQVP